MLKFRSLGSGSSGNAYLVVTDEGHFLIDAGVAIRKLLKGLFESGSSPARLEGLLITHDHFDHTRNIVRLQRHAAKTNARLRVGMTERALQGIVHNTAIHGRPEASLVQFVLPGQPFALCGCRITAFPVPHDSFDNVGYFIDHQGETLCLVTDCGHCTDEIDAYVGRTENLILEANYDRLMLDNGPYPAFLKQRIKSGRGHLSNDEAAAVIFRHREHLERVWLCHRSQENNTMALSLQAVEQFFQQKDETVAAHLTLAPLPHREFSPFYEWSV